MWKKKKKKVGLALGSGSARGWSHIGAIEALEEAGVPIHFISGTSIGAFVGAVYATGDLPSLKEFALQMDWKKVVSYFDVVFPKSGFMDGKKVHDLFSMHTEAKTFDDFKIPVSMVATNIETGEKVIINSGNIIEGIRASISVPGVFTPVKRNGEWLVDGGLVDPIPVSVVKEMGAEFIIAVDLNSDIVSPEKKKKHQSREKSIPQRQRNEIIQRISAQYNNAEKAVIAQINRWFPPSSKTPNIIDIMGTSIGIMQEQISRINLSIDPPDILIQPRLGDLKMFDFDQAERSIKEGYTQTKLQLEKLKIDF
jgi:NTE family protein